MRLYILEFSNTNLMIFRFFKPWRVEESEAGKTYFSSMFCACHNYICFSVLKYDVLLMVDYKNYMC